MTASGADHSCRRRDQDLAEHDGQGRDDRCLTDEDDDQGSAPTRTLRGRGSQDLDVPTIPQADKHRGGTRRRGPTPGDDEHGRAGALREETAGRAQSAKTACGTQPPRSAVPNVRPCGCGSSCSAIDEVIEDDEQWPLTVHDGQPAVAHGDQQAPAIVPLDRAKSLSSGSEVSGHHPHQGTDRVGPGPPGQPDHGGSDQDGDRAERVVDDLEEGARVFKFLP